MYTNFKSSRNIVKRKRRIGEIAFKPLLNHLGIWYAGNGQNLESTTFNNIIALKAHFGNGAAEWHAMM